MKKVYDACHLLYINHVSLFFLAVAKNFKGESDVS
jgi:hypothetical protein